MVFGLGKDVTTIQHYLTVLQALEAKAQAIGGLDELKKITAQAQKVKTDFQTLDSDARALAAELGADFDALVKELK